MDDRVVACPGQIAAGHEYLLFGVQHIDIDTDSNLISEFVGFQ